jgi:hypothetical protein
LPLRCNLNASRTRLEALANSLVSHRIYPKSVLADRNLRFCEAR